MIDRPGHYPEEPDWQFWLYYDGIGDTAISHRFSPNGCQRAEQVSQDWSINFIMHWFRLPSGWRGPFEFPYQYEWAVPRDIEIVECRDCNETWFANAVEYDDWFH